MKRRVKGATLVEILVVALLFTLVIGSVTTIMLSSQRSSVTSAAYVHAQQQARQALDAMAEELRLARPNRPPNVHMQITDTTGGINPDTHDVLRFQVGRFEVTEMVWGAPDLSGDHRENWFLQYRLNGTQLVREILNPGGILVPGGRRVLANDAQLLDFAYDQDSRMATVRLQIRQAAGQMAGGPAAVSPGIVTTQVKLRNTSGG
ncbi:MAG: hypothetical protein HY737_04280 [Candidatus Omnitrophica bacterium]|nr:hypothetical protein [Candidatus Omnitrophota bacterium]